MYRYVLGQNQMPQIKRYRVIALPDDSYHYIHCMDNLTSRQLDPKS